MFGVGTSSRTSGSAPTRGSPSTRSARRAASAAAAPARDAVRRRQTLPHAGEAGHRLGESLLREPARSQAPRRPPRGPARTGGRARGRSRRRRPRARAPPPPRHRPVAATARISTRVADDRARRTRAPRGAAATAAGLIVAGSAPSSGTTTCAVITAETPAAIAARNGSRWASRSPPDDGQLEVRVRARVAVPGEVLGAGGDARALQALDERRHVPGRPAPASDPNERTPITGLSGFVLTSATGAKSRLTPTCASSDPSRRRPTRVRSMSSTTPSARCPGYELPAAASSRVTSPPSSSVAIRNAGRSLVAAAPSRRSAGRASRMFLPNSTTPPSPRSTQRSRLSGASCPSNPGRRQRGGELLGRHPRTAPAVRPNAIRRCTSTKKTTTGSAVSEAAAISGPHSVPRSVVNEASQTGSVCLSWLCSRT